MTLKQEVDIVGGTRELIFTFSRFEVPYESVLHQHFEGDLISASGSGSGYISGSWVSKAMFSEKGSTTIYRDGPNSGPLWANNSYAWGGISTAGSGGHADYTASVSVNVAFSDSEVTLTAICNATLITPYGAAASASIHWYGYDVITVDLPQGFTQWYCFNPITGVQYGIPLSQGGTQYKFINGTASAVVYGSRFDLPTSVVIIEKSVKIPAGYVFTNLPYVN